MGVGGWAWLWGGRSLLVVDDLTTNGGTGRVGGAGWGRGLRWAGLEVSSLRCPCVAAVEERGHQGTDDVPHGDRQVGNGPESLSMGMGTCGWWR